MNKRLLGGLLAAGIVGGGVFGFAASLDINQGSIGAGNETISSCDPEVDIAYATAWQSDEYQVATVTVSAIDAAACANADIKVTLVDEDGGRLGSEIPASTVTGASEVFTVPAGAAAELVDGIHVVIDA
jgi:hypothetical protein